MRKRKDETVFLFLSTRAFVSLKRVVRPPFPSEPVSQVSSMVTELITCDEGKTTKGGQKSLKGAMKVIKKLKGRIGLG